MNTCLTSLYLKICQFDSRQIRIALTFLTLLATGGVILGLPIHGDVAG